MLLPVSMGTGDLDRRLRHLGGDDGFDRGWHNRLVAVLNYRDQTAAKREDSTSKRRGPAAAVLLVSLVLAIALLLVGVVFDRDERISKVCFTAAIAVVLIAGAFTFVYYVVSKVASWLWPR